MTIRKKIFLLAGTLLVLFAMVVGLLAFFQKLDSEVIANISEYELPLSQVISEFDVYTDRYELGILRLLQNPPSDSTEFDASRKKLDAVRDDLESAVLKGEKLLATATRDRSYDTEDRVGLARISGSLKYLSRGLDGFLQVGDRTLAALREGRLDDARNASLDFRAYEDAFGPDLSQIRHEIDDLTARSTQTVLARQRLNTLINLGLFIIACAIGLGVSAIGSMHVVAGLRQLVVSTRAVESGLNSEPVTIRTRDEVGELAQSFNRMMEELRSRETIKETFGKFIDPRLVSRLIGGGTDQAERRTLTVFFSDIKQFSGISEQLTAGAVVHLLNNYFASVADVIHAHHGIIDKYIGDAVMAFWVPPFSKGDEHAAEGCLAALAQQEAIAALRERISEITGMRKNAPDFFVRMGVATGEAVVGTIGSESARSYTVIGDTVNLASRLESINKVYGTSIMISEETFRLAQGAVEARELDTITVAGKTEPIRIFELMARAGALSPGLVTLCELFADGLTAYRRKDWDRAQAAFAQCLQAVPDDPPSQLFIERISRLRTVNLAHDWDGVWRYSVK